MRHAVEKVHAGGRGGAFVTERGTSFGYNDLVVDFRGLVRDARASRRSASTRRTRCSTRAARGTASDGDRRMVAPLARAAVAVGIDALFVEVHPDPERAPCDGPSQIDFEALDALLAALRPLDAARRGRA